MKQNPNTEAMDELRNAAVSEPIAVAFLEKQRWGANTVCPRCESAAVYRMMDRNGRRNKDHRWRCKGCERMFSVRTGTPLEETRLPLRVWVYAIWKAASSKKGLAALELSREMEITHKSALFALRRLRHGLAEQKPVRLTRTVEVDDANSAQTRRPSRARSRDGDAQPTRIRAAWS